MPWYDGIFLPALPPKRSFATALIEAVPTNGRNSNGLSKISSLTHPDYKRNVLNWAKWRAVYEAGDAFADNYLEKFSLRESDADFLNRKKLAPIPAFAKAAVNDIKNSIYQRVAEVARSGGSESYQRACRGLSDGVDLYSSSMNSFIGTKVIPELLTMKRVGVYVDMPPLPGPTVADHGNLHPYLYYYKTEDILNYRYNQTGQLIMVLLRDHVDLLDSRVGLPVTCTERFRLLWIDPNDGFVRVAWIDRDDNLIGDVVKLGIRQLPFHIGEISDSLLRDVANHQIALLNLDSSDIAYLLRGNVTFYTEQIDPRTENNHLKSPTPSAAVTPTGDFCPVEAPPSSANDIDVGTIHGRRYALGLERPGFIAPPTEPIKTSMEKQNALKDDIRNLVNLALSNIQPKFASAESKAMDQYGLEAGLSAVGLVLEVLEQRIAQTWADYEGSKVATIKYPRRWTLKSDEDRRKEAKDLNDLRPLAPSVTYQREISKLIAISLLGDKTPPSTLDTILKEIDDSPIVITDPDILTQDLKDGLITKTIVAKVKGYPDTAVADAKIEQAERLALIAKSQAAGSPAARGLPPEVDPNPNSGQTEKLDKPVRGEAQ
jgi:hypothetical protein